MFWVFAASPKNPSWGCHRFAPFCHNMISGPFPQGASPSAGAEARVCIAHNLMATFIFWMKP